MENCDTSIFHTIQYHYNFVYLQKIVSFIGHVKYLVEKKRSELKDKNKFYSSLLMSNGYDEGNKPAARVFTYMYVSAFM